ncbi:tyrosine-type recombinase/integrase [Humibacter sp.]|uniref:tyrosine-type recombinase/integrase n=1 Tax=Humibacter sp. TaxID=1940291 RepID=UPI003F820C0B
MPRPPLPLETWGTIRRTTIGGKPTAIAYYRDSDGVTRPMQRQGRTPTDAENRLKEALRDRLAPANDDLTRESTLAELAELWLAEIDKSKRSAATKARYRSTVHAHINRAVGAVRIREATVPRLQRMTDRVAETSGDGQARMLGVVLRGMFDLAVRMIPNLDSPAAHVRLPERDDVEVRAPNLKEVHAIRKAMSAYDRLQPGRNGAMHDMADPTDMLLATGARPGEVLALDWEKDIDLENGTVTIQATVVRIAGLGIVRQEHTKERDIRKLPLPAFALDMLVRRRVHAYSNWVFPSQTGRLRWPENFRTSWASAVQGTPVEWTTPKATRKAVAHHLDVEIGIEAAQDQLGHADPRITRKSYAPEAVQTRTDRSHVLSAFAENHE